MNNLSDKQLVFLVDKIFIRGHEISRLKILLGISDDNAYKLLIKVNNIKGI